MLEKRGVVSTRKKNRNIWYHDGIETKRQCICKGHLTDFSENSLKHYGSKKCVGVVYSV